MHKVILVLHVMGQCKYPWTPFKQTFNFRKVMGFPVMFICLLIFEFFPTRHTSWSIFTRTLKNLFPVFMHLVFKSRWKHNLLKAYFTLIFLIIIFFMLHASEWSHNLQLTILYMSLKLPHFAHYNVVPSFISRVQLCCIQYRMHGYGLISRANYRLASHV